jgi:uncharacterized protein YjbI with pentapeptide repeats
MEHREPLASSGARDRVGLRADCERCFGLCCVAPAFSTSTDFAIDKAAGQPCPNLQPDFRCGIHQRLRQQGFPGCAVYDCFGAGQKVAQETFGGLDWRQAPRTGPRMFEVFGVMRQLHELLWYLSEALSLPAAQSLFPRLQLAFEATERLTHLSADALLDLDVAAHRADVTPVLRRASELARASVRRPKPDRSGADLIGAKLNGADLRGVSLRGALLVGANLSDADLRQADLTGADLRGADLRGADLTGALFVVQAQLDAAKGDARTKLPPALTRPRHWSDDQAS